VSCPPNSRAACDPKLIGRLLRQTFGVGDTGPFTDLLDRMAEASPEAPDPPPPQKGLPCGSGAVDAPGPPTSRWVAPASGGETVFDLKRSEPRPS